MISEGNEDAKAAHSQKTEGHAQERQEPRDGRGRGGAMSAASYSCADGDAVLVAISDLQPDGSRAIDPARLESVRRAMAEGTPLPAVALFKWKHNPLAFLVDGRHRLAAAVGLGHTHLSGRFMECA